MQTSNGFTIAIEQNPAIGTPWVVRTYKRVLGFRRLVSSDWFLDGEQARQFAEQLAGELERGSEHIRNRKPGWTLHRPAR